MGRVFIAEKPSLAKEIANALGGTAIRRNGYIEVGEDKVAHCFGHMLEQMKPEEYDRSLAVWSMESLPFIPQEWVLRPRSEKNDRGQDVKTSDGKIKLDAKIVEQIGVIKSLVAKASMVVNAGDADREGQIIVDELLDWVGCNKEVQRLWLQELNVPGIQKAIARMKSNTEYRTLSDSARGRSIADFLIGMNCTRGYTKVWQGGGNAGMLHVGRVQTPTLWLVRERELQREAFVAVDHFGVKAWVEHDGGEFQASWQPDAERVLLDEEGRVLRKEEAEGVRDRVASKTGAVEEAKTEPKRNAPPLPFTLLELQKQANRYGLSPSDTLEIAQRLYEEFKVISYPRTDCPYLPTEDHGNAAKVIDAVKANYGKRWDFPGQADVSIKSAAWDDSKLDAHFGIVPTVGRKPIEAMGEDDRLVYGLIVKRYLAQFYRAHEFEATVVLLRFEGEWFKATGRAVTQMGWRVLYASAGGSEDDAKSAPTLPKMSVGDRVRVQEAELVVKRTEPPPLLDGASLLDCMKNVDKFVVDPEVKKRLKVVGGLGTEATRATTIKMLVQHKYTKEVPKKGGKSKGVDYVTTEHGRGLLQVVNPELSRPDLTAWFESKLEAIVQGQMSLEKFIEVSEKFTRRVVESLKSGEAAERVPVVVSEGEKKCTECGKGMSLRTSRQDGKQFWGCRGYPECKNTARYEGEEKQDTSAKAKKGRGKRKQAEAG